MASTETLKSQVSDVLTNLQNGERVDRQLIIQVLKDLEPRINETDVAVERQKPFIAEEATPVRTPVSNWKLGTCKRCLRNGIKDGDIIVKIHGKGWWHDACYRIVNPAFYVGI